MGFAAGLGAAGGRLHAAELPAADLQEMEQLLAQLNFDPGAIDGVVDERTRTAIRLYQEFAVLPVTGQPDAKLLQELRQVSQVFAEMHQSPSAETTEAPAADTEAPVTDTPVADTEAPAADTEAPASQVAGAAASDATPEPMPDPAVAAMPPPANAPPQTDAVAAKTDTAGSPTPDPNDEASSDAGPAALAPAPAAELAEGAAPAPEPTPAAPPAAEASPAAAPQIAKLEPPVPAATEEPRVAPPAAPESPSATPADPPAEEAPATEGAIPPASPSQPDSGKADGFSIAGMIARLKQSGDIESSGRRPPPQPAVPANRNDPAGAERTLIWKIQHELKRIGIDPGPTDGSMRDLTRRAIHTYQRARGLPADGRISEELLARLEAEATPAAPSPSAAGPLGSVSPQAAAINAVPRNGYEAFKAGYGAAQAGDYDSAVKLYEKAIEGGDLALEHLAAALYNRANAYQYLGVLDKAIDDYSAAIANKPNFPAAYYNRGFAFDLKGEKGDAVNDFRRARDLGLQRLGVRSPDLPPPLL